METYIEDKDGFDKVLAVLDKALQVRRQSGDASGPGEVLLHHGTAQRPDADQG